MKKYLRLFYVTAAFLLCAFAIPEIAKANLPEVTVTQIKTEDIMESIVCSGTIQEKDNEKLSFDVPIYPASVNVKEGDKVEKGDLLVAVDKTQTVAVLASAAGISKNLSGMNIDPSTVPTAVYAPVNGTVTSVNVQEGRLVSPSTTLLTIAGQNAMQVVAQVSENRIGEVEIGQEVIITGAGFKNHEYKGTIEKISSEAKQIVSGTAVQTVVDITIAIQDADDRLKSGFTSKAEIITEPSVQKVLVPYEAVNQDGQGNEFVYVWDNGCARKRIITTGKEYNSGFEILDGIKEGEYVINDIEKVKKDGSYVKAIQEQEGDCIA